MEKCCAAAAMSSLIFSTFCFKPCMYFDASNMIEVLRSYREEIKHVNSNLYDENQVSDKKKIESIIDADAYE